jgi:hypothetical protein
VGPLVVSFIFLFCLNKDVIEYTLLMFKLYSGSLNRYNAGSSSTYRANGANFHISYGDGSYAGGHYDNDTVTVSGYKL